MDKPLNDRVVFRYSVGDICLFRLGFRASHDNRPFDPHAAPVSIPLEPREIPKGSAVLLCSGRIISHRLWPIQATRSALCYVRNQVRNHYIDLSQGFEKYEQGFSGKTKSTLRRKVRKIMDFAEGTFECRAYRDIESVEGFHRLARRVAAQTYQEKLFGGAIPAASGFVEEMRHLASEDRFRGFLLLIKDTPIAYLYVPVSEDRLIYGYLGHDPEYAIWSPGTVLLYLALERLFAERKLRYSTQHLIVVLYARQVGTRIANYVAKRRLQLDQVSVACDQHPFVINRLPPLRGV